MSKMDDAVKLLEERFSKVHSIADPVLYPRSMSSMLRSFRVRVKSWTKSQTSKRASIEEQEFQWTELPALPNLEDFVPDSSVPTADS